MARTQLASGDQEKAMHELLVHQVELEMQNEELRRLQAVLDALKPPPIGWLDRRVGGGVGVMLDDLAAAFGTLLILAVFRAWG